MVNVEIRTYHGRTQADASKLYAQDAAQLMPLGYQPVSQSWAEGRSGCLRVLLMGFIFAYFFRPAGTLTVTYSGETTGPLPPQPKEPTSHRALYAALIILAIIVFLIVLGSAAPSARA